MSDFNSSLPIRTQTNGDAVVEICDGSTVSQKLTVNTDGSINTRTFDGSGNTINSTSNALNTYTNGSVSFGSVSGGTAGTSSELVGGIYNSTPPTLTNGQQAALQLGSDGSLLTNGSAHTQPVSGTVTANQGTSPWVENITQVGGSSISLGQKTSANSFPVVIASDQSTIPVYVAGAPGTAIADYKDASAIAAGASDNHDYTVTAGKTLHLQRIESSGSGKAKMDLKIETGVSTGTFNTYGSQFNSTATPNMPFEISAPVSVAAGVRVRVTMTNRDLLAQDLYSTIMGYEI